MPAITIGRLDKENITDLALLFFSVYGRKIPVDFFPGKYNTSYTGVEYLGFIAYSGNRMPIAFYGVIPCYVCCDGNTVLAAQSADTMTHPAFRNRGLFVKLAGLTVVLCWENKVQLLFGFPNQHSLPGFINKLGWEITQYMHCFIIPVPPNLFWKTAGKFPFLQKVTQQHNNKVLQRYTCNERGKPPAFFSNEDPGVWRSEAYLLYKTYSCARFISIQDAFVWFRIAGGFLIGDLFVQENNFEELMQVIVQMASEMGLDKIIFHCTETSSLHRLFADRYEAIRSFPVIFKKLGAELDASRFSFTYADIDTF